MRLPLTSSETMCAFARRCIAVVLAAGAVAGPLSAHAEQSSAVPSYAVAMAIEASGEKSTPRILAKAGEQFAVVSGEWRFEMTVRPGKTPEDVWLAGKVLKGDTIVSAPTLMAHLNEKSTIKVGDSSNLFTLSMVVSPTKSELTSSNVSVIYNIALQNEYGIEKQTVTLPTGDKAHEIKMVGGIVQITPPNPSNNLSVIKFFKDSAAIPVPMHTASIDTPSGKSLEIAYTLCGQTLRFQSPAPEKLEKCPTVASVTEQ